MARPTRHDKVAALSVVPLFDALSDEELAGIADLMTEREVTTGTVLAREGDPGREATIIVSGTALVRRRGRVIDEMAAGDFFGEMSLVNREPRGATVTASSDMELLVMNSEEFFSVLEANATVAVKILRTVAARVAAHEDRGTI